MTRKEAACASLLLAFMGWCWSQHMKGRKAVAERIRIEELEADFYATTGVLERMHGAVSDELNDALARRGKLEVAAG